MIDNQQQNTKLEFQKRAQEVIIAIAEQGLNAALFYENPDPKTYISMVPTSAHSGDGMGNLMGLLVQLSQTMLAKRLAFSEELQATVLEVKAIPGLGTTIDIVLVNGSLKEGQTMILAGTDGPIVTPIKALLTPAKMQDLRVKVRNMNCYRVDYLIDRFPIEYVHRTQRDPSGSRCEDFGQRAGKGHCWPEPTGGLSSRRDRYLPSRNGQTTPECIEFHQVERKRCFRPSLHFGLTGGFARILAFFENSGKTVL